MFNQEYTPLEYSAFAFTVASALLLAYVFSKHAREITTGVLRVVWHWITDWPKFFLELAGLAGEAVVAVSASGNTALSPLRTSRMLLRQPEPTDDRFFQILRSDPDVNRYLDRPKSATLEEARQFIAKINDYIVRGESFYWVVAELVASRGLADSGHGPSGPDFYQNGPALKGQGHDGLKAALPVGTICLWNFSPENDSAEVGYELLPAFQGKGYMQEALAKVIEFGFEELALPALTACVHAENEASIRLLEKFDFERTGTHGENELVYTLTNAG